MKKINFKELPKSAKIGILETIEGDVREAGGFHIDRQCGTTKIAGLDVSDPAYIVTNIPTSASH